MIISSLQFLTTWITLLVVLHHYTYEYIDLLYLTFLALLVGSYVSFIHPKLYTLESESGPIIFSGFHRFVIIDIAIHIFLFCFTYYHYSKHYKKKITSIPLITSILLVFIYMVCIDTEKVYRASFFELFWASVIATCLYFLL